MDGRRRILGNSRIFYGWVNVGIFFLIAMVIWGPQYSFGVFFKPLAEDFTWSRAQVSAAMTINLIVGGLLGFIVGKLNDRYGPRKVMSVAALFIGGGYVLLSQTSSLWQFYLWFGLIVGIGTSTAYIVPAATVSRWFITKRGIALSITLMGMGFSQIIVPPIMALAITKFGWSNSYALIGISVMVLVLFLTSFLRKSPEDYRLQPDGIENNTVPTTTGEKEIPEGFSVKQSIHLPAFWILFILWILLALPVFLTLVHVVPLATDVGIDPLAAATVMSFIGLGGIGGRLISGYTCDRWGSKATAIVFLALVTVSMVEMMFARQLISFYIGGAVFGASYNGADTALVKMIGDFFGRRYIGALMGLLALGWRIGAASGPFLGGIIYDITSKYQASFITAALCTIVAIFFIFLAFHYKPSLNTQTASP